jgi:hypothetical protein
VSAIVTAFFIRLDDDDDNDDVAAAEERLTVRWQGEGRPLDDDDVTTSDDVTTTSCSILVYDACRLIFRGRRAEAVRLQPGSFVLHETDTGCASLPRQLARVLYLYEYRDAADEITRCAHVQIFFPGTATCLGRTGNPLEYFATARCQELPLSRVVRTLDIAYRPVADVPAWRERGGTAEAEHAAESNGAGGLFWRLRFDGHRGRFEVILRVFCRVVDPD